MSIEEVLGHVREENGGNIEQEVKSIMRTGWRYFTDEQVVAAYVRATLRELGEEMEQKMPATGMEPLEVNAGYRSAVADLLAAVKRMCGEGGK